MGMKLLQEAASSLEGALANKASADEAAKTATEAVTEAEARCEACCTDSSKAAAYFTTCDAAVAAAAAANAASNSGTGTPALQDGCDQTRVFEAGAAVRLQGLLEAPELNGHFGVCEDWLESECQWRVCLQRGDIKNVKRENLEFHAA